MKPMQISAATCCREIHIALWRSFNAFEGRCSMRTWVYRIAHNTAASYITRQRRTKNKFEVDRPD
jgi:RNA polymerase sigma-70 factor (ECF subfamily)